MPRRVNLSRVNSAIRQFNSERRRAINSYNQQVRAYNSRIQTYRNKQKRAIEAYNQRVRTHNSRVRANRTRLQMELNNLTAHRIPLKFREQYNSVAALSETYTVLDSVGSDPYLSDLAERETANSVTVLNDLLDESRIGRASQEGLNDSGLEDELSCISPDLDRRWRGALYALSPQNPDASRHFCISSREIFTEILNIRAPNKRCSCCISKL